MAIIQRSQVFILALLMVAATFFGVGALSPALPKAHADAVAILQVSIEMPAIPCHEFQARGVNAGSVNRAHRKIQDWNRPTSANDAWGVFAVSVIAYCPEYYGTAPTVDGVPYGPWIMIPTTGSDTAEWKRTVTRTVIASPLITLDGASMLRSSARPSPRRMAGRTAGAGSERNRRTVCAA